MSDTTRHCAQGLILLLFFAATSGCGVRGRPQPPLTPPEIGRGQPTFRRATEPLKFPSVPPIPTDLDDDNDDEENQQ